MQTKDEAKRHKVASYVFSNCEVLGLLTLQDNVAKKKEISVYNHKLAMLKDLAEEFDVMSPNISCLKPKDTI